MTSAQYTTGLGNDTKPTSRVLRPPGGGSSNILNPEPEEHANRKVKNYNRSDIFNQCADDKPATVVVKDYNKSDVLNQSGAGGDAQKPSTAQRKEEGDSDEEAEEASKTAPPPVEAPVRVKGPQHGINPITGMVIGAPQTTERPSTKVHHPPGGKSTALW
ncbi:jupiter microtubule associated homolog 1 isoform X4 [Lingula anatina]|uniref:Microtubule-associated protein Jupiter n=1 Tax=Lingula anatina TaxID=7574 RepID=A0A1S3GYA1_LINAN|nr:jupiter microtubule associated homolog 1 isoform X4 [Lingula anatina]|eukprot:XP_013378850.1 jupiter microtubule associated homolog 1 isoform X4 [Lingula anatina]